MTGDCPVCGAYMIFTVGRERCDRCECARLRDEAQHDQKTLVLQSEMLVEKYAEIARLRDVLAANRQGAAIALDVERAKVARLREAIQREANRHSTRPGYIGGALVLCNCEICRIAREGR